MSLQIGERGLVAEGSVSERDWLLFGTTLKRTYAATQFAVGDWMNYGIDHGFSVDLKGMAAIFGWAVQSMRIYQWVARQVPYEVRVPNLTFSHHMTVAKLRAPEQVRWLSEASAHGWSATRLKKKVNGAPEVDRFALALLVEVPDEESLRRAARVLSAQGLRWKRVQQKEEA